MYSNDNNGQNITMLKFGDVGLESRDIPTLQSYLAPLPSFFYYIANALKPPSTTATVPVTNFAASDMR